MKQHDPYQLLDYWRRHYDQHGVYPTIRGAARDLGVSSNSVMVYWLQKLAAEGLLDHFPNQSQAYRIPRNER